MSNGTVLSAYRIIRHVRRYLKHCGISAIACILAFLVGTALEVARFADFPLANYGPPMAILNFLAAIVAARKMPTYMALWVWVPNALLISLPNPGWVGHETIGEQWSYMLGQTFGPHRGESLDELVLGASFVGTSMYSLTAGIVRSLSELGKS
jgi:hypothetical protein